VKILLTIFLSIASISSYCQYEVLPTYKWLPADSLEFKKDTKIRFLKTIRVAGDTLPVVINSTEYLFSFISEENYAPFTSPYNQKYNLGISSWQISKIEADSITFTLTYTRIHKANGSQKGKHFIIENYKISKNTITGISIGETDVRQLKNAMLVNLGLYTVIIGAIIIGSQ
jgi:hypothetical protein